MSRFYKTSQATPIDYGFELPYEEMYRGLMQKQGQQDAALSGLSAMGQVGQVRDVDKEDLIQWKQRIDQQSSELARMDLTSSDGKRKFMEFTQNVRDMSSPGGAIGQMYENYARQTKTIDHLKKLDKKDPERLQKYIQMALSGPKTLPGGIDTNMIGGDYYNYQFDAEPVDYIDIPTKITQHGKDIAASSFSREQDSVGNWIWTNKTTGKEVSYDEVLNVIIPKIGSDSQLVNYYKEGLKFEEYDLDENGNIIQPFSVEMYVDKQGNEQLKYTPNLNSMLGRTIDAVAKQYSFRDQSVSNTTKINPLYEHEWKKKLDEAKPLLFIENENQLIKPTKDLSEIKTIADRNLLDAQGQLEMLKNLDKTTGSKLSTLSIAKPLAQMNSGELAGIIKSLRNQDGSIPEQYQKFSQKIATAIANKQRVENYENELNNLSVDVNKIDFSNYSVKGAVARMTRGIAKEGSNVFPKGAKVGLTGQSLIGYENNEQGIYRELFKYAVANDLIDYENNSLRESAYEGSTGLNDDEAMVLTSMIKSKGKDLVNIKNKYSAISSPDDQLIPVTGATWFMMKNPDGSLDEDGSEFVTNTINQNISNFDLLTPGETGELSMVPNSERPYFDETPRVLYETTPREDGSYYGYVQGYKGTGDNKVASTYYFKADQAAVKYRGQVVRLSDYMSSQPAYKVDGLLKNMVFNTGGVYEHNDMVPTERGPAVMTVSSPRSWNKTLADDNFRNINTFYNDSKFQITLKTSDGHVEVLNGPKAQTYIMGLASNPNVLFPQFEINSTQFPKFSKPEKK